jgi:hypothetical protein
MTKEFRPYAADAGQGPAALYRYIRHCLTLRGGKCITGVKWIWKTCAEAAEALGASERSVRRWFQKLVALGWLKREKLAASSWYQAWFYTLGDSAPLSHRGGRPVPTDAAKVAASFQSSTPAQSTTAQGQRGEQPKQPERKEAAPPRQGWPELDPRGAALALEQIRQSVPFLNRRRPAQGFA